MTLKEIFLMIKITQKYSETPSKRTSVGLGTGLGKLFSTNIPDDFNIQQGWKHYGSLLNHFPIKGHLSSLKFLQFSAAMHILAHSS